MRFPPPARYFVPVVVLVFGLLVTFLDFQLNLANDQARDLAMLREQADATGERLAKLAAQLPPPASPEVLRRDLAATADAPGVELAAVIDAAGRVLADSSGELSGQEARHTRLAPAARLARKGSGAAVLHQEDSTQLYGAYPVEKSDAWVLVVGDRAAALDEARRDAQRQLRWTAGAVALLCFALWAILHYGFAERLTRLTHAVRGFGAPGSGVVAPIRGGDEVAELSGAFAGMAARVRAHEQEHTAMEREALEAGENERRRIGHELHDGLGQRLTAAAFAAHSLGDHLQGTSPAEAQRAHELAGQLRQAIAETRQLSHGLAPIGLENSSLGEALAELTEAISRGGRLRAVLECATPVLIPDPAIATHLFRIAQEAVSNAQKHANASEIRVGLEAKGGGVVMEIEDDGDGLPDVITGGGMGLRVMRHRAQLLGGTLELEASPAGGTLVRCRCPWPAATAG